jgi:branched-chain amino acid transport system substrate-binding protein
MRKMIILLVVSVGVTLGFSQTQAAEPIHVGLNEVRSGAFKSIGDKFLLGVEIAVKEINKTGGLLGRPVELVVEDNQMKPEVAVTKLKKMILEDKCEAIFQASSSAVALAISQTMPRYKKIYIPMASFAMDLTGKHFHPYVFRTDSNVALFTKAMALYIAKQKKEFKKVYMINMDYAYGHDVADFYERFIREIAPDTQIMGKDFHPMFNKDFGPYISKVKASGADYLLTGNWGTDLIQLIIQARSLGLKIPFAGILQSDPTTLAAMPGDEAVGNFGVASFLPGVDTPKGKQLEESFYEKSGVWPAEQVWYAYKAMILYAEAVKKAGSLDVDKIIKAFENLKFDGPTGIVSMRAKDHQLMQPMIVGQVVKKTKYFDFPYLKPLQLVPLEQLDYKPEDFGWKPYKE